VLSIFSPDCDMVSCACWLEVVVCCWLYCCFSGAMWVWCVFILGECCDFRIIDALYCLCCGACGCNLVPVLCFACMVLAGDCCGCMCMRVCMPAVVRVRERACVCNGWMQRGRVLISFTEVGYVWRVGMSLRWAVLRVLLWMYATWAQRGYCCYAFAVIQIVIVL